MFGQFDLAAVLWLPHLKYMPFSLQPVAPQDLPLPPPLPPSRLAHRPSPLGVSGRFDLAVLLTVPQLQCLFVTPPRVISAPVPSCHTQHLAIFPLQFPPMGPSCQIQPPPPPPHPPLSTFLRFQFKQAACPAPNSICTFPGYTGCFSSEHVMVSKIIVVFGKQGCLQRYGPTYF